MQQNAFVIPFAPSRQTSAAEADSTLSERQERRLRLAAVPAAGLFLGMGLAGAVLDGLLLQGLLGWHPLSTDPQAGSAATSLFFVATLVTLLVGLDLLRRLPAQVRRQGRRPLLGWGLLGAGLFGLLVGIGDHHLAGLRHLRPEAAAVLAWDLAYLAGALTLLAAGAFVLRRGRA